LHRFKIAADDHPLVGLNADGDNPPDWRLFRIKGRIDRTILSQNALSGTGCSFPLW
jgi:hypothetical protein